MKKNRGVSSLLIFLEVALLVVVVVLGIVKFIGKDKTPSRDNSVAKNEQVDHQEESDYIGEENIVPQVFSEEIQAKLEAMTLEEKVAQMFLVTPETLTGNEVVTLAGNGTRRALTEYPVGGLVYSAKNLQNPQQFVSLLNGAQNFSFTENGNYLFLAGRTEGENVESKLVFSQVTGANPMLAAMTGGIDTELPEGMSEAINSTMKVSETIFLLEWDNLTVTSDLAETAALEMHSEGKGAVLSIKEGADILYTSNEFKTMYQAVLIAVENGTLNEIQINNAVGHILTKKGTMSETARTEPEI